MPIYSAGIILYRQSMERQLGETESSRTEILLVHPGGPYWANKDTHGWSIPKGEFDPAAELGLEAAEREFEEELGSSVPLGNRIELGEVKASSKIIRSWLVEGNFEPSALVSNTFELEWPPRSGKMQYFPEVDRCCWFDLGAAKTKLHKGQVPLLDAVQTALAS